MYVVFDVSSKHHQGQNSIGQKIMVDIIISCLIST